MAYGGAYAGARCEEGVFGMREDTGRADINWDIDHRRAVAHVLD